MHSTAFMEKNYLKLVTFKNNNNDDITDQSQRREFYLGKNAKH